MEYTNQLVGNQPIQTYLQKTIKNGTVANAQLWLGPEQVGKSTFLINYIYMLSCLALGRTLTPCLTCTACLALKAGSYPNVRWLNAADKAVRVDTVLAVRGSSLHTALYPGPRVLVIENAEQLHPVGSNALLKLLEEPTAGLYIILLSTAPDSILATIKSRCLVINFSVVSTADLATSWPEIASATVALAQGLPGRVRLFQQQPKLEAVWLQNLKNWLNILMATSSSQRLQLAAPWLGPEKNGQPTLLDVLGSGQIILHDILQIQCESDNKVLLTQFMSELQQLSSKRTLTQTILALTQIQIIWKRLSTTPIQKKLVLSNLLLFI